MLLSLSTLSFQPAFAEIEVFCVGQCDSSWLMAQALGDISLRREHPTLTLRIDTTFDEDKHRSAHFKRNIEAKILQASNGVFFNITEVLPGSVIVEFEIYGCLPLYVEQKRGDYGERVQLMEQSIIAWMQRDISEVVHIEKTKGWPTLNKQCEEKCTGRQTVHAWKVLYPLRKQDVKVGCGEMENSVHKWNSYDVDGCYSMGECRDAAPREVAHEEILGVALVLTLLQFAWLWYRIYSRDFLLLKLESRRQDSNTVKVVISEQRDEITWQVDILATKTPVLVVSSKCYVAGCGNGGAIEAKAFKPYYQALSFLFNMHHWLWFVKWGPYVEVSGNEVWLQMLPTFISESWFGVALLAHLLRFPLRSNYNKHMQVLLISGAFCGLIVSILKNCLLQRVAPQMYYAWSVANRDTFTLEGHIICSHPGFGTESSRSKRDRQRYTSFCLHFLFLLYRAAILLWACLFLLPAIISLVGLYKHFPSLEFVIT